MKTIFDYPNKYGFYFHNSANDELLVWLNHKIMCVIKKKEVGTFITEIENIMKKYSLIEL